MVKHQNPSKLGVFIFMDGGLHKVLPAVGCENELSNLVPGWENYVTFTGEDSVR